MPSGLVPACQLTQLHQAYRGAQLVHAVVEAKKRHVVFGAATDEALARVGGHTMRPGALDHVVQPPVTRYDRTALSSRHVLVAVEGKRGRIAKRAHPLDAGGVRGVLDQEQTLAAS